MPWAARLVDIDGVTELLTLTTADAPGDDPLVVDEFDLGFPDVREDALDEVGQDGTDDATRYVGAAGISASFTAQPARGLNAWQWIERLRSLSHPGRRLYLYLTTEAWDTERRILVGPRGVTAPFGSSIPEGQAQWKAPVGLWEAATPEQAVLTPAGAAAAGLTVPFSLPVALTPANRPGSVTVNNAGSVAAFPVADIYGPCAAPVVTLNPGKLVSFPTLTVADGQFVRVDMANRTALLNGDPAQSVFNKRDFAASSWWPLPIGRSQVSFTATNPGAGCRAVLSWRPRYI